MPPERRVFASPPRSPEMTPIAFLSSPISSTTQVAEPIPSIHIPESWHVEELSKVQQQQQLRAAAKRQSSQSHEAQPRHQHLTRRQHRRLQDAHEEYHRQRELFQAQQQQRQQQQQEQQQYQYHHHQQMSVEEEQRQHMFAPLAHSSGSSSSSSSGQYSSSLSPYGTPAPPLAPSRRFSNRSSLSRSSSSSSLYHPSLDLTEPTEPPPPTTITKPRSRRSSPGIPDLHHHPPLPRRRSPYSAWTAIREKERTRLLTNLSTLRESLQTVPLPSQVARENLGRLHQRIQHRRARARETILYDLHQGVKVVEAQVHRQVEMVLSRLKEAPASKYAFALTNSFLSQIPHTVTGSLLAQAANGLFQTDSSTFAQEQQQQQQQASSASVSGRNETDALSNDFDSIALAGQLDNDRPSALAGLGDPNGLSTRVPPGVAAACTQILSAALPSFIPSMVAPLVCVFSYQTPSISDLASIPYTSYPRPDASSSPSSSNNKVEEPARKEFVYPWGHPNEPPPPTFQSFPLTQTQTQTQTKNQTQSPSSPSPSSSSTTPSSPNDKSRKYHRRHQKQQSLPGAPDSGIVVVHSKTWTQHEREALYLAATRFRLSGQWSKIREMMNLHRTDKEIETEYKKLYAHRENENDFDDDEDEDYHYDATTSVIDALSHQDQFSNSNANSDNDADVDDIDDDDDEETEKVIFMKFGGGLRSAQQRRQQLQHQQSRRLHYDQLHFQQQPVPQQELQHHHQHQHQQQQLQFQQQQEQQQEQQHQGSNSTFNVPPLHDNYYQQLQQQQQPQQSLLTDSDPIRIYKKEFMIDKRFALEEIPMRI